MKQYDVIVIGGGISGLSFAHFAAAAGKKVIVLEKNGRVGGCFHSHRFSGEAEGFWLELGAHTCYNSYLTLVQLLEQTGIIGDLTPRQKVPFKIFADRSIVSVLSRLNLAELLFSVPRAFGMKKEGESVASYYSRIVGKGNYEQLFSAAFNAVLSQPAGAFPADMLFKKRQRRRKDVAKSFTMAKGLQEITEKLSAHPGMELKLAAEVKSIARTGKSFEVVANGEEVIRGDALVMAVPPPSAAELLKASYPELSAVLGTIKTERVETLGVAIPKDKIHIAPVAGIIGVSEPFYSAVSRDTVPAEGWRGFAFHFKPQLLKEEQKLLKIAEVLSVKREDLRHTVYKETMLPSLSVGHDNIVREINRMISGEPLFITGNYFFGLAIEDCVSRSHEEFSRLSR